MRSVARLFWAVLSALPAIALAAGYGPYEFGMTREQVRAVTEHAPYYSFRNGDLGTKAGSIDGTQAPISFYFENDRLVRIMIVVYSGPDFDAATGGWVRAFEHIHRHFGGVEVPTIGKRESDVVAARRAFEESGLRARKDVKVQMGAFPMPKDRSIWTTANIVPSVGYWVAVNYAEP
jgi:hypothetical protein